MCQDRPEAERALAALRRILAELGLEPKEAKTRIVHLRDGGEGFDFLGFHHRWVRARATRRAPSPFSPAGPHARRCSTPATASVNSRRGAAAAPVETVMQDINRFLRGWAGYFRYGNSARPFDRIMTYALARLALFVAKRHKRREAMAGGRGPPLTRPAGPDQPQRDRRRSQTELGLAGKAECRR